MKKMLLLGVMLLAWAGQSMAQIPHVTIRDINQVPPESLLVADNLQNSIPSRWTLQASRYIGDTVTVTALVVVPAKVLTFTAGGFTMLLSDTAASGDWRGLFVRVNAPADTDAVINNGFLAPEAGDIVEMTGIISEFPSGSMNSSPQLQPLASMPITIVGSGQLPVPRRMTIGDFYQGVDPGGKVRYSTGEPLEGMLVEFVNATVDNRVNAGRGTFSIIDAEGNQISTYDASRYYTLGHGGTLPYPADTTWQRIYPVVGTHVDTIRGYITTVSGQENPRGYRIAPVYRSDLVLGAVLPSISTHRRYPIIVSPDSTVRVTVRVQRQTGGSGVASVSLLYSLNDGAFTTVPMAYSAPDTAYAGQIPQQAAGTFVHYFMQASDSTGNVVTLANAAASVSGDTSKGFFSYTVLDRPITIQDIQSTPYAHGRSSYVGGAVSVSGIVTADTSHIGLSPLNTGGTSAWYIQSGNSPFSGIWLSGTDTTLKALANGDSISVTGTIQEQFDVTRIGNIATPPVKHSTGNAVPAPVDMTTGAFGPTVGSGFASAEPYEGMLVRFTNVRVTSIYPVFSDPTEFEVDDGSGPVIVRRDGKNRYSNVEADTVFGKTILREGDRISALTGVVYFSFRRYKIVPRTDADFGTITDVDVTRHDEIPGQFGLAQNYPNPFNPTTTIQYDIRSMGRVVLKVYNLLGQEVRTLVNDVQAPGRYSVRFDASSLSSGVYFCRLQAGSFTAVRKLVLMK